MDRDIWGLLHLVWTQHEAQDGRTLTLYDSRSEKTRMSLTLYHKTPYNTDIVPRETLEHSLYHKRSLVTLMLYEERPLNTHVVPGSFLLAVGAGL